MDTHTIVPKTPDLPPSPIVAMEDFASCPPYESRFDAIAALLDGADRALSRNVREARRYIAGARALLSLHSSGGCVVLGVEHSNVTRGGLGRWRLARATEFVENNLARPITLQDLAGCVHLTRCHFARAFRCSVGEPPHAYIVRRRIERAQQAMLSTCKPLSAIALECGLADQSHLTRLFRRLVGISPAAWRRLYEPVAPVRESRLPLARAV
jgi:AraC family transcriptional regulator